MHPIRALRHGWLIALVCLAAWSLPARAQVMTFTVQSLDEVLETIKYGMTLAGQGEQARQLDGMITDNFEGFKGLDTKKPWGSYFAKFPIDGKNPKGVLYVPITKEEDFLALLARVGVNSNKDDGGLRTLEAPFGPKMYMRIKEGYAFVAEDEEDLRNPLDPAGLAKALPRGTLFRLRFDVQQIPAAVKTEFLKKMDEGLAKEKAKKEGENEHEFQARQWGIQFVRDAAERLVKETQAFEVTLQVDRDKHMAAFEAAMVPVEGSSLASEIRDMTKARTQFASLSESSAAFAYWNGIINEHARKDLDKIIDFAFQQGIEREPSVLKRAVAEKVFKVLEPTLKSDVIDLAVALRQNSPGESLTGVAALRVKNGKQIEQLLKELTDGMKEKEKEAIKFDADKVNDVNIHVINLPAHEAERKALTEALGAPKAALAFHDKAAVLALGKNCVEEVKKVLNSLEQSSDRPASLQLEFHGKAFTRFEKNQEKRKAMDEAFSEPGSDVVRLAVTGGDRMRFRVQVSTHLLKLARVAQVAAE